MGEWSREKGERNKEAGLPMVVRLSLSRWDFWNIVNLVNLIMGGRQVNPDIGIRNGELYIL